VKQEFYETGLSAKTSLKLTKKKRFRKKALLFC